MMRHIIKSSYLFCWIVLGATCGIASGTWDTSNSSEGIARSLTITHAQEQYTKLQALKGKVHPLAQSPQKAKLHLYEVYRDQSADLGILFLGTDHTLPFDVLPQPFMDHFTAADEIYVEGETISYLNELERSKSDYDFSLDKTTLQRYESTFLKDLLANHNGKLNVCDLTVEQLYALTCVADSFLGMDAEIALKALAQKKPVYMLDKKIDLFVASLKIHEEFLKPEERLQCLDSMGAFNQGLLIKRYLEQKGSTAWAYPDAQDTLHQYNQEDPTQENLDQDDDLYLVHTRNQRWFQILKNSDPTKKKLCCVGVAHLKGLFDLF